ncbi:MAG: AEC family transporter [Oligoflexales bacterium]|nr:AEC family transporter [Oligoflexales bacterium]
MFIAVQSVLSIIVVIACGFLAGRRKILPVDASQVFSILVVQMTFPVLLFTSLASSPIEKLMDLRLITAFFFSLMSVYVLVLTISRKFLKRSLKVSAMMATVCSFPNMAFMGIPYLSQIFGDDTLFSVAIGNLISSAVMMPLTIIFLERSTDGAGGSALRDLIKREILNLLRKPFFVAPFLGIFVAAFHIPIPSFLLRGLKIFGDATSPIALFALGLMMTRFKFTPSWDAVADMAFKLVLQPLSAVGFMILFGLSGKFAAEIIILIAMPTGIIVPMFAEKYDIYKEETVSSIVGSSILSTVTLVFFTLIAGKDFLSCYSWRAL